MYIVARSTHTYTRTNAHTDRSRDNERVGKKKQKQNRRCKYARYTSSYKLIVLLSRAPNRRRMHGSHPIVTLAIVADHKWNDASYRVRSEFGENTIAAKSVPRAHVVRHGMARARGKGRRDNRPDEMRFFARDAWRWLQYFNAVRLRPVFLSSVRDASRARRRFLRWDLLASYGSVRRRRRRRRLRVARKDQRACCSTCVINPRSCRRVETICPGSTRNDVIKNTPDTWCSDLVSLLFGALTF